MWKTISHLKVCCSSRIRWCSLFGRRYLTCSLALAKNLQNLYKIYIGFVKKHGIQIFKSRHIVCIIEFYKSIKSSNKGEKWSKIFKFNLEQEKEAFFYFWSWTTCKLIHFRHGVTLKRDIRYRVETLKGLFYFCFRRWALMEMCWQNYFLFCNSCSSGD